MKVFITGATGFVGAHTALELLKAGHELRMLVRNEAAARQYFERFGYTLDDIVVADMADSVAVKKAMSGCDAVIHSAAMVSLDPKQADAIYKNNVGSIDAVIGSAYDLGIKNIIYVSSLGALFEPGSPVIDENSPLAKPKEAYSKSKRDCDAYVRNLQAQGAPIHITYPSGVFGPDDPKLSESNHALITFLSTLVPRTSSGIQCVDVRDVAFAHRYLIENPQFTKPVRGRFILAGHFYPWHEFHALLEQVTGEKISSPKIPGVIFRAFGSIMDMVKMIVPIDLPITSESMAIVTQWTGADSSRFLSLTGTQFRSGEETFTDTIKWLADSGHLDKQYAGKTYH